jgi:putative oxidoreductase
MNMLFSTPTTLNQTPTLGRGRFALVALWVTQVAVAGMFMFSGGLKLTGAPQLVALFDSIGVGQWFRYVTGSIEVVSAAALLVPPLAPFGALLLVPTMVCAIGTHLLIVGGSPVPATVLLIGALAIVWARRHQLASAFSRLQRAALSNAVTEGESFGHAQ